MLDQAMAMLERVGVNPGEALQAKIDALRLTAEAKSLRPSVGWRWSAS